MVARLDDDLELVFATEHSSFLLFIDGAVNKRCELAEKTKD